MGASREEQLHSDHYYYHLASLIPNHSAQLGLLFGSSLAPIWPIVISREPPSSIMLPLLLLILLSRRLLAVDCLASGRSA